MYRVVLSHRLLVCSDAPLSGPHSSLSPRRCEDASPGRDFPMFGNFFQGLEKDEGRTHPGLRPPLPGRGFPFFWFDVQPRCCTAVSSSILTRISSRTCRTWSRCGSRRPAASRLRPAGLRRAWEVRGQRHAFSNPRPSAKSAVNFLASHSRCAPHRALLWCGVNPRSLFVVVSNHPRLPHPAKPPLPEARDQRSEISRLRRAYGVPRRSAPGKSSALFPLTSSCLLFLRYLLFPVLHLRLSA